MTHELLEYKMVQALGYILSPNVTTNIEHVVANRVIVDFGAEMVPALIYLGVVIELGWPWVWVSILSPLTLSDTAMATI